MAPAAVFEPVEGEIERAAMLLLFTALDRYQAQVSTQRGWGVHTEGFLP